MDEIEWALFGKTLKELYGTSENMFANYRYEIKQGEAHCRAEAEMMAYLRRV